MPLKLPSFRKSRCQMLTACGEIVDAADFSIERLVKKKTLSASYKAADERASIRIFSGGKKGNHLHIDIATPAFFGGKVPKATHKRSDIDAILNQVIGMKVNVGVRGMFVAPVESLPADGVIRSLSVQKTSGKVGLKMTGGTVSVEGAPIRKMEWSLIQNGKRVRVAVWADKSQLIHEDYLVDLLKWIESTFDTFVLGKESHAYDKEQN
ncbi:MAG: hypothetical protein HY298_19230 [Verrucomicrobia bacterium]|nr:hypothetical protein [Verrucomicrobiota bacterium]